MLLPSRHHRHWARSVTRCPARNRPLLPAWLLQAPVLFELLAVVELSLLAAVAIRTVWLQSEDKPSAVAFGFLITIVIARCWHMWWSASRGPTDPR
jgi:hypothetical protein